MISKWKRDLTDKSNPIRRERAFTCSNQRRPKFSKFIKKSQASILQQLSFSNKNSLQVTPKMTLMNLTRNRLQSFNKLPATTTNSNSTNFKVTTDQASSMKNFVIDRNKTLHANLDFVHLNKNR